MPPKRKITDENIQPGSNTLKSKRKAVSKSSKSHPISRSKANATTRLEAIKILGICKNYL